MTARYRIDDGTGGTYVGAANNCSQDSNQALFASITMMQQRITDNQRFLADWFSEHPEQAYQYKQLLKLKKALQRDLHPLDLPRSDWLNGEYNVGAILEDRSLRNWVRGLGSWRTL